MMRTSPALRYSRRVTPRLNQTGGTGSYVDCGTIHNAAAKLWVSFSFEFNDNFPSGADLNIWAKWLNASNRMRLLFLNSSGILNFEKFDGGGSTFSIGSAKTAWADRTPNHVIASISDVAGVRLIVNGAIAVTNADTSAVVNGGNFVIGHRTVGIDTDGFKGRIWDFAVGTDDLTLRLTGTNTDLIAGNDVTQDGSGAKGQVVAAAAGFITVARTNSIPFVSGADVKEDIDATDLLENVVLNTDEERELLRGIIPADATELYRLNEGFGLVANDLRGADANGTIGAVNTWGTGLRQYLRY